MRAARPLLTLAALALVLVLGACDDGSSDDDASTSSTAPPVTAGPVAASALVPGDCVTGLVLGIEQRIEIDSASVVRCDQPHDVEVFAVFDLLPADLDLAADDDGSYPGRRRIVDAAGDGCDAQLEQLGDVAESIGLISVWPTAESWAQGDRAVACAAYSITGSPIDDEILGR